MPGDYQPNWKERFQLCLGVSQWPASDVYLLTNDTCDDRPFRCANKNCLFRFHSQARLEIHMSSCTSDVKVESCQVKYGKKTSDFEDLIKENLFPVDTNIPKLFCVFDIETLEQKGSEDIELRLASIAISSNFSQPAYFVRKSMEPEEAQKVVSDALDYLRKLADERNMPSFIQTADLKLNERIQTEGNNFQKQKWYRLKNSLKKASQLCVFGFNSSKFDLKVLIGYMAIYCRDKNLDIQVLKRDSKYFSVQIDTLCFKGNKHNFEQKLNQFRYIELLFTLHSGKVFDTMVSNTVKVDFPLLTLQLNRGAEQLYRVSTL